MFNAIRYTQELEKAGFSPDQAEASVKILIDVMNENFATKPDLKELELLMKSDLKEFELSIRTDLNKLESTMNSGFKDYRVEMRELEYRLTIKLGTLFTVGVGATAAIVRMLQGFH